MGLRHPLQRNVNRLKKLSNMREMKQFRVSEAKPLTSFRPSVTPQVDAVITRYRANRPFAIIQESNLAHETFCSHGTLMKVVYRTVLTATLCSQPSGAVSDFSAEESFASAHDLHGRFSA
jgi:hypothetical protein